MRTLLSLALAGLLAVTGSATAATLDRIMDSGTLRIGYRADAAPFSYRNSIGDPAGYTVNLCQVVAQGIRSMLQIENFRIEYVEVGTENRFDMVESGKVDLLCGATTATLKRREQVDFSLPTFVDGASVMYRENGPGSFKELEGRSVGVRANTTTEEGLRNSLKGMGVNATVVTIADHDKAVEMLENSEIDAYFADRSILQFLILGRKVTTLRISPESFSVEPYALALKRGDADFRLVVDRALSEIYRSPRIVEVFRQTFGQIEPSDALRTMYLITALPN